MELLFCLTLFFFLSEYFQAWRFKNNYITYWETALWYFCFMKIVLVRQYVYLVFTSQRTCLWNSPLSDTRFEGIRRKIALCPPPLPPPPLSHNNGIQFLRCEENNYRSFDAIEFIGWKGSYCVSVSSTFIFTVGETRHDTSPWISIFTRNCESASFISNRE